MTGVHSQLAAYQPPPVAEEKEPLPDDPVSFQVYQQCGLQCQNIADYIRRLGYPAFPSIVGTYTTLITPLIIEAGLGENSRLGIAINPFIGAAFKAVAVLTDLPLEPEEFTNKWWSPLEYKDGKLVEAPEFDYKLHERRQERLEKLKAEGKHWGIVPDYE